jgi:hypothetical protein
MKYQTPNTSFEVEVFETVQQIWLLVRDSEGVVIHQEAMAKWLDPQ